MYGQPTRSGRFELPGGAASRYSGAPMEVTLSVSVCSPIGTGVIRSSSIAWKVCQPPAEITESTATT